MSPFLQLQFRANAIRTVARKPPGKLGAAAKVKSHLSLQGTSQGAVTEEATSTTTGSLTYCLL